MRNQFWQAGVAVALACASANAQSIRISQSIEPDIVDPGSVACAAANPQRTTENSYYRTFDLTQFPAITGPFHVTLLEVGVELAQHPSPAGEQDITVNLWVDCNGGAPRLADLTLVGSFVFVQINTGPFIESIPVDVTVCQDATLVVEVNSLDHRGQTENAVYFIGSNALGQNSPSYIRAAACGLSEISDIAGIGFPDMHIVLNVLGDIVASCTDPCAPTCPCACDFDPDPTCNIFDFLAFQTAFVAGDPCACDIDPDPACNIFDFLAFQNQFVVGCP